MLQQAENLQKQVRWSNIVFKDLARAEHGLLQNDDGTFINALLK